MGRVGLEAAIQGVTSAMTKAILDPAITTGGTSVVTGKLALVVTILTVR